MLTPKEKSPLPEIFSPEEDQTHDAASSRTASPTHYQLSYSCPPIQVKKTQRNQSFPIYNNQEIATNKLKLTSNNHDNDKVKKRQASLAASWVPPSSKPLVVGILPLEVYMRSDSFPLKNSFRTRA